MNPTDEMDAKLEATERPSAGVTAGSDDKFVRFDEQLRATVKNFQRTSDQWKPVEDLQDLLSQIDHHLDTETSERRAIYYRLVAIESEMKRRSSRGFARYLVAICIGVAATLAWQSYGEATKQIIATKISELGRSPETKQMIASWMQRFGWQKPPLEHAAVPASVAEMPQAAPVGQAAPENVAPKTPAVSAPDPEQVHQIALDLAALRQSVEQLAAGQDQMAREIDRLQAADMEILAKIPSPPLQPPAVPARKPVPIAPPSSRHP
jgi:hypothetical protein